MWRGGGVGRELPKPAIAKIRCGAQTEPQLAPTTHHEHGVRAACACAGRASARASLGAFTLHAIQGRFESKNPTSQRTARKGRNARREPRHALASMPPHASTSARTTRGAASAYGSARVARTSRARDRARSTTTRSTLEERRGRFGRSFLRPRVRLVCLVLKPCERAASDARKRVRRAVARGERHAKTRQNNFARRVLRIASSVSAALVALGKCGFRPVQCDASTLCLGSSEDKRVFNRPDFCHRKSLQPAGPRFLKCRARHAPHTSRAARSCTRPRARIDFALFAPHGDVSLSSLCLLELPAFARALARSASTAGLESRH